MNKQELEKFKNAIKKKEFRDLLTDYAKEIQDPENKKVRNEERFLRIFLTLPPLRGTRRR